MTRKNHSPATVRCAIYTRKSTEVGLEQNFNSLDAQREASVAYIQSQRHEGWKWASIDGSTLRAPAGEQDDRADAMALACAGRPAAGRVWLPEPTYDRRALSLFHPDNLPKGIFLSDDLPENTLLFSAPPPSW